MSTPRDTPTLPAALRERLGELAGPAPTWTRLAHATNEVWRADDTLVLKKFRGDRPYRQELRAYIVWRPHLSEGTPALLAADDETRALVLTHVPGDSPIALTPRAERAAHWHAGQFLKMLHTVPDPDPDPLPLANALSKRHAAALGRVAPHLAADERAALHALAADLPALFADAARVPAHRDYTPRNWLVRDPHAAFESFTVLDFEHARHDTPLADLVKLAAELWPTRPDLEHALLAGYGRDLTARERHQLRVLVGIHAMATLAWAHDHRDPTFLAAGRTALATALAPR